MEKRLENKEKKNGGEERKADPPLKEPAEALQKAQRPAQRDLEGGCRQAEPVDNLGRPLKRIIKRGNATKDFIASGTSGVHLDVTETNVLSFATFPYIIYQKLCACRERREGETLH